MVTTVGIVGGAVLTLVAVVLHLSEGSEWQPREDISQEVIEQRAEAVPETDFPEPSNRSIGGGGAVAAVGGAEAGGEGELAEEQAGDESPAAIPDDEAEVFEVEYVKEGETVEVKENETLLEAGEEMHWPSRQAYGRSQSSSSPASSSVSFSLTSTV